VPFRITVLKRAAGQATDPVSDLVIARPLTFAATCRPQDAALVPGQTFLVILPWLNERTTHLGSTARTR
jgi:hypothetical protein